MSQSYTSGAVATPHVDATAAAHHAFANGGNAVDAALAAAAMLTVVYPNQCSIGGDAIAMVGTPDGRVTVVNGTGTSAQSLRPENYVGDDGFVPVSGAKSVTVPGLLGAWEVLAHKWGRLPLASALLRAADAAAAGVPVAPGVYRDLLREEALLAKDQGCREVFFRDGTLLGAGQTMKLDRLSETLTAIAHHGIEAFYKGAIGKSIVATLKAQGSDLTSEDFGIHESSIEAPLATTFAGSEYLSAAGNSQGTFFLQGMSALDIVARELGHVPDAIGAEAGIVARILAETAKDRDRFLGDPRFTEIPFDELLSEEAAAGLANRALAGRTAAAAPGRAYARRTGDTVAIVTADSDGTWVSLIQSAFHAFGSCVLDPGTGILLHNRGASFSLVPGAANELAPGRKPAHTLMPVLVRRDGQLVGAHGTMGGRAQPQVHTHLALNLALGLSPAEATGRPRWIVGQMEAGAAAPDDATTISVEQGVSTAALQKLHSAGFRTKELEPLDDAAGHLQVVRQGTEPGTFVAGSDPRSDGLSTRPDGLSNEGN
ncbi:gamma-glutamyltransferase family protein [Paenarthrobacter sp. NPDC056912]|uniref:gamma-glutamyltransferase family protein n=1 Tax=Paenarthrobacter sp. NPDC056912 TaxID=3345965 RepID=UPI00367041F2